MGSKGTQQKTTEEKYQAAQPVADVSQDVLGRVKNLAQMGYTVPTQQIADLNGLQYQAIGSIADYYNLAQQPYQQAQAMAAGAGAPISGADVSNYLNPYAQYALAGLQDVQGAENVKRAGALTRAAGGIGADRAAVAMAEKYRQDQLARGQLMSSFYQPALAAAQADRSRQLAASQALGGLGAGAQQAGISGSQALFGAGAAPQSIEQQRLNAAYSAALANIEAPWKMAQIESGIAAQQAPVLGGTKTSTTTMPGQSPWGTIAGLGLTAAGIMTGNPMMAGAGMKGMSGGGGMRSDEWAQSNPGVSGSAFYGPVAPGYASGGAVSEDDEPGHFFDGGVPSMGGGSFISGYGGDPEGFGTLSPYAGLLSTGQTPDIPEDASWAYPSTRVDERFPVAGEIMPSNPYELRNSLMGLAAKKAAEQPIQPVSVRTKNVPAPTGRPSIEDDAELPPAARAAANASPYDTRYALRNLAGLSEEKPAQAYSLKDFLPERRDGGIGRRLLEAGLTMLAASGERDKFGFPISPWAAAGRGGMAALAGQAEEEKTRAAQEQKALDLMEKARAHRESEEEKRLRREELGLYRQQKEAGVQSRFEARQTSLAERFEKQQSLRREIADRSGNYSLVNYIDADTGETKTGVMHSKTNQLKDLKTGEPANARQIVGRADPNAATRHYSDEARRMAAIEIKAATDLGRPAPDLTKTVNKYRRSFNLPDLKTEEPSGGGNQRPSNVPSDALFSDSAKQYWSADKKNAWDATGKQILKDGNPVQ